MTTQPPLPLYPTGATEISAAAAMIEDEHGGGVFVHGNLAFTWDGGDTAGRRFAAVSLMRIKAATQVQVAAAFGTSPLTADRKMTQGDRHGEATQRSRVDFDCG